MTLDFGACAVSLDDFADLGRCVKSNPGLSRDHVLICSILISLSMAGAAGGERSVLKRAEGRRGGCAVFKQIS